MIYLLVLVPLVFAAKQCLLGRDSGEFCGEPGGQRFYFDLRTKKCQPFYYKGCGGNQNRFDTKANCMMMCSNTKGSTATAINAVCKSGAYAAGATSLPEPLPVRNVQKDTNVKMGFAVQQKTTYAIYHTMLVDSATKDHTDHGKYFFARSYNNCMLFTYYGRDGNANNFETYNECKAMCMS